VLRCYLLVMLGLVLLLAGCDRYPRDPGESLDHINQRGVLRVGASPAEPWVVRSAGGELGGAEGRLIEQFADTLGVQVDTYWSGEEDLFQMLGNRDIDVVVAGMSRHNPWSARAGFTLPYYTNHLIVGLPAQSPLLADLEGVTVGILHGSPLSGVLEEKGAVVTKVEDLATASLPVAGPAWQIRQSGLTPTAIRLDAREHVMAVPRGENALLLRLERFLFARSQARIEALLGEEATR
jgi:polar amino acid transport system substrate-binding protein